MLYLGYLVAFIAAVLATWLTVAAMSGAGIGIWEFLVIFLIFLAVAVASVRFLIFLAVAVAMVRRRSHDRQTAADTQH